MRFPYLMTRELPFAQSLSKCWLRRAPGLRRAQPERSLVATACGLAVALAGCGGGNPLDNPSSVNNPGGGVSGQKLSFAYFQKCINPIFLKQLQININGTISNNKCAGSGCHESANGTGGALRVVAAATDVDVTVSATNTVDQIRASDMYKNFYSAQGSVVVGSTTQSLLLAKPLNQTVLHGGGLVFPNDQDPNAKLMQYWITHPAPKNEDEFSTATYSMFTPAGDPVNGTCNTQ